MSESAAPRARTLAPSSRGTATARRISTCAVALVLEHGYEATTVDMICAEAGVSQRTFFNHFPTKDASIIGTEGPQLDESAVRAFIASDSPSILADAAELIATAVIENTPDADFMRRRMRAITTSAALMQRQLEQFDAIERELAEILRYRLAKVSRVDEPADAVTEQARLAAQLLAGVMRYTAGALMGESPASVPQVVAQTRERLSALLPKLG